MQTCKKSKISLDRHFLDGNFPKKARTLEMQHFARNSMFYCKINKNTNNFKCFILFTYIYLTIGLKECHSALFTFLRGN